MKYKDIKEEFRKKYGFIGNWEEMQYWLEMCPDTSFLFENIIIDFSKALDSNTKRVKKESVETIKRTKYTKKDLKELAVTNMSTRIMKAHNKAIDEAIKAIK